jgi:hypothetical protein
LNATCVSERAEFLCITAVSLSVLLYYLNAIHLFRKLRKQISVKTEAEISDMRQEMENVLQPEKPGTCTSFYIDIITVTKHFMKCNFYACCLLFSALQIIVLQIHTSRAFLEQFAKTKFFDSDVFLLHFVWNSLPADITSAETISAFRKRLKTFCLGDDPFRTLTLTFTVCCFEFFIQWALRFM